MYIIGTFFHIGVRIMNTYYLSGKKIEVDDDGQIWVNEISIRIRQMLVGMTVQYFDVDENEIEVFARMSIVQVIYYLPHLNR